MMAVGALFQDGRQDGVHDPGHPEYHEWAFWRPEWGILNNVHS